MAGWKPIATAPRETGRPLLLYPFPWPRGSAEKIEALPQPHDGRPLPLLDLADPAVRRFIKLAKRRGYVTGDELDQVLPPEEFSVEQIEDVIHQFAEMGINVVETEETRERAQPRATTERKEPPEAPASDVNLSEASWAVYGNVFEGYWDGTRWLSAGGVPCEPTHWMPLPSPPLVLARR
jgi:hypothetical protein